MNINLNFQKPWIRNRQEVSSRYRHCPLVTEHSKYRQPSSSSCSAELSSTDDKPWCYCCKNVE